MASKTDLITMLVEKEGLSNRKAERVLNTIFGGIKGHVKEGELVRLRGFGTFRMKRVAEKMGRNPQTGEPMVLQAHDAVKFKCSRNF